MTDEEIHNKLIKRAKKMIESQTQDEKGDPCMVLTVDKESGILATATNLSDEDAMSMLMNAMQKYTHVIVDMFAASQIKTKGDA